MSRRPTLITGDTVMERCDPCTGTGYRSTYPTSGRLKIKIVDCAACGGRGERPKAHPAYSIAAGIAKGLHPQGYTITANDIGRALTGPREGFGVVHRNDVGKRCWVRDFGFTMESADQRDARNRAAALALATDHPGPYAVRIDDSALTSIYIDAIDTGSGGTLPPIVACSIFVPPVLA